MWSASGGDSPQKMVTEACDRIASGEVSAALLCGGEALSTGRHLVKSGQTVDWSEDIDEPVDEPSEVSSNMDEFEDTTAFMKRMKA